MKRAIPFVDTPEASGRELHIAIEGLRSDGAGNFVLSGFRDLNVDYGSFVETLVSAGLTEEDAATLVDRFSRDVFQHTLAKALAERIKPIP